MRQPTRKRAPAVRVGRTPIGRGVFARRRFRAQQIVGVIRGQVIDDPDYSSDYCMELDDGRSLEPAAPFRYLNHSCQPNCELFSWETDEPAPHDRLWLQALTAIEPGEELTIDYAWPADAAIPCACGATGCRGWIVSPEELPLLVQTAD
ncbi:MAG TPA: SET domain-containing protein-lysine N-methyltransferase [Pirellulales bacterium]|nr:SET domain-containing protein-lysine N-methyltransferase [Pirellulales bacterium]